MKQIVTTAFLLLAASPATALSCMQPDIAFTYQNAVQATETIAILRGQISYDRDSLIAEGTTVQGSFTGIQIGPNGDSTVFTRNIAVGLGCAGPWCGSIDTSPNVISFVTVTPNGFEIIGSPCPGGQFSGNDLAVVAALAACLRGEECAPGVSQ